MILSVLFAVKIIIIIIIIITIMTIVHKVQVPCCARGTVAASPPLFRLGEPALCGLRASLRTPTFSWFIFST